MSLLNKGLAAVFCFVGLGWGQTAPTAALTTYTATDQSASAGVPSGWKVTSGSQTVIQMSGPEGATLSLGTTVIAHNAAFQAGQKPGGGVDLSMPYTASLAQKLGMIVQQNAAISGDTVSATSLKSSTPITVPAVLGQCGRFVATYSNKKGAQEMLAVLCSLPMDAGGNYKNVLLIASAPASVAAQVAPAVQAVFGSYKIPEAWLGKKLAPFGVAPAGGAVGMNRATAAGIAGSNVSANCFDLAVLRSTPQNLLPKSCGGLKPD